MNNITPNTETCRLVGMRFYGMEDLEKQSYKPAGNDYMVYEDTLFCSPVEENQTDRERLSRVFGDWIEVDFDNLDADRYHECKLIYFYIKEQI